MLRQDDAFICAKLLGDTLQAAVLYPPNHSAGNFCAGIAGRLGCKVIGMIVYNDRSADYLIDRKTIGQKQEKRKTVISEQRRQISGMVRMRTADRIIM